MVSLAHRPHEAWTAEFDALGRPVETRSLWGFPETMTYTYAGELRRPIRALNSSPMGDQVTEWAPGDPEAPEPDGSFSLWWFGP